MIGRMNVAAAALAAVFATSAFAAEPFKDGDDVVFYGDSITHGGWYHTYLWEYYVTRYPESRITFRNAGVGGDNAKTAQHRFADDVAAYRPTDVVVMFGMNDVRRDLFASSQTERVVDERKKAAGIYRANLEAIDELIGKAAIPRVYRLTPTPYEDTAVLETRAPRMIGCNAGLGQLAEVVRERAAVAGGTLVDFHSALNAYNRDKQEKDPTFTIIGPDRVHPQFEGHLLMAYTFLKAQNADGLVSDIGLDYARQEVEKARKATVSDVRWDSGEFSFTVLEKSLPMPIDPRARRLLEDIPLVRDLNQEILAVRSLPRGTWALEIDGVRVAEATPDAWERGLNLSMNEKTPQHMQAQRVHDAVLAWRAVQDRLTNWKACKWWLWTQGVDSDDWQLIERFWNSKPNRTGYFEQFYPDFRANWDCRVEQEAKIEEAANACRAAAKPVSHRYRLVRLTTTGPERLMSRLEIPVPVSYPFESTVIVQGTQSTSAFAVKEFNAIVRKTTGRTFEVRTAGCLDGCADKKKIFIGRGPELDELMVGWWIDKTYGEEESVVLEKEGSLCLFGRDELGSLWAVYDFCEDSLGYRWYLDRLEDKGGEKVVKTDVVRWNGVATRRQPAFRGRRNIHNGVRPPWGSWLYRVRNRDNAAVAHVCPDYRSKLQVWTRGHGFNIYLPPGKIGADLVWAIPKGVKLEEDNFKKHPEWFSLMKDGTRNGDHQMCLSNPGCRRALLAAICEYMRVCGKGVYMVGENDARFGRYCHCDGCIALERKYNTTGGPMWDFIIEACREVKRRFGDGFYLTSLAYDGLEQTEKAPDNAVFPDNFIVDIAYIHMPDRSIKQLPDRRAPEGEMVNYWQNTLKWCSITAHQSYWFYGTENPCMVYRRMADEIRDLREADIESVGACGTGGGYEFCDLTRYLYYRLIFDPRCDVRRELEEACAFKYGAAAPVILAYIDELENTFIAFRKTCPNGRIFETNHQYLNLGFVPGRKLVEWRNLLDRATKLVADSPFHAANVRFARIGLDLMSVFYADRIARDAPEYHFDRAMAEAEGIAIAREYGATYVPDNQVNEALDMLEKASNEMAYYGELKNESLPPELTAVYQPQFVTRILPYKRKKMRSGKFTSEPDPKAACGYAIADVIPDKDDLSQGVSCYIWNKSRGSQLPLGTIPLSAFKKDRYVLYRAGTTTIPPDSTIIIDELWVSPLAISYLNRCHNPSAPQRKFDIWLSMKAEGPKFFPGDARANRLLVDQIFAVELVDSGL